MAFIDKLNRFWVYSFAGFFLLFGGILILNGLKDILTYISVSSASSISVGIASGCILIALGVFFTVLGGLIILRVRENEQ
jgi:hypothetical protein